MSALQDLLRQIADPATTVHPFDEAYDLALARGLTGADRTILVGHLIDASRDGDGRAVLTLGYIQAFETLPALIALAETDDPLAVYARRSVAMMGRAADVVDGLLLDTLNAKRTTDRIEALRELAKLDAPLVRPTLQHALGDPDFSVREAAWEALVDLYGLRPLIVGPDGKRASTTHLELANALQASDLEAFVRMGTDELQWVFRRLDAGATPASLGIAFVAEPDVFDTLRRVLFQDDQPFPLEAIARLTGISRRYAEFMIAMRLEDDDPRVPPALQELGACWALPGLVDHARDRDDGPSMDAVRSLQTLARTGWLLDFKREEPIPLSTVEGVVSRTVGPPTTVIGELSGNPRDFYARDITITAHDPEGAAYLTLNVLQNTMGEGDPNPLNSINGAHLYMRGRTPEEQTATYQRLRDELAELGFTARVWRSQADVG